MACKLTRFRLSKPAFIPYSPLGVSSSVTSLRKFDEDFGVPPAVARDVETTLSFVLPKLLVCYPFMKSGSRANTQLGNTSSLQSFIRDINVSKFLFSYSESFLI